MLAALTLWQREIVRFYRDKGRVIGGLVPPIMFWFFLGSGLGDSFHVGFSAVGGDGIGLDATGTAGKSSMTYLQYFFPGTLVLIFLFTAVFSTISIIEDRKEGFLQSVLVAPVPRAAIALGKIFGSASLAFLQGLPFFLIAPLVGIIIQPASIIPSVLILFGTAFFLSGVGYILAWKMDSVQGFHAIMNMLLIPLWLLSGALFPIDGAPGWLGWIIRLNPLTYCVAALQNELFPPDATVSLPGEWFCAVMIMLLCAGTLSVAVFLTGSRKNV